MFMSKEMYCLAKYGKIYFCELQISRCRETSMTCEAVYCCDSGHLDGGISQ